MRGDAEVLTAHEGALILCISTNTMVTLARDGARPGEKVGRDWRFIRSDVLNDLLGDDRRKAAAS